jgi:hypothetical protein
MQHLNERCEQNDQFSKPESVGDRNIITLIKVQPIRPRVTIRRKELARLVDRIARDYTAPQDEAVRSRIIRSQTHAYGDNANRLARFCYFFQFAVAFCDSLSYLYLLVIEKDARI